MEILTWSSNSSGTKDPGVGLGSLITELKPPYLDWHSGLLPGIVGKGVTVCFSPNGVYRGWFPLLAKQ